MGCAGSKSHHISTTALNTPPQKGFIIFNANTIEYIRANELKLRQSIRERCELKLSKNATIRSNKSNIKQEVTCVKLLNETHTSILEIAIDSLFKYITNDFDMETFKSSNHLSIKQIKKDILKKQSSSTLNSTTSTLASLSNTKTQDSSFFKKALNVSIDEFGCLMQEKVIEIDEFNDVTKQKSQHGDAEEHILTDECPPQIPQIEITEVQVPNTCTKDDDAVTLKEALEIARRNFYSGKTTVVCTTQTGNYVVKEMKSDDDDDGTHKHQQQESSSSSSSSITSNQILATPQMKTKTVTMFDTQTKQTTKIAISQQIDLNNVNLSGNLQIIDTSSSSSSSFSPFSNETKINQKELTFIEKLKQGQIQEISEEFFQNQDEIVALIESKEFNTDKLNMLVGQMNENCMRRLNTKLKSILLSEVNEIENIQVKLNDSNESLEDENDDNNNNNNNDNSKHNSSSFSSPSDLVSSASDSPISKKDSIESLTNDVKQTRDVNNHVDYDGLKEYGKRLSVDEELISQLQDVDKKVKYLTETCSENDDNDELTNNDHLILNKDDDMFFNPTRNGNPNALQEEIKQISNVIQDLVQTINVNQSESAATTTTTTSSASSVIDDKENIIEKLSQDKHDDNNVLCKKDRKSISSIVSSSSIPVSKTRLIQKHRTATCMEDDHDIDSSLNNSHNNSTNSKKRFKSKLPVKK